MRSLSYCDCDRFLSIHGTVHELVMDIIAENANRKSVVGSFVT